MERFTGWQYLLIDAANAFGLDKKLFHERIEWAEAHLKSGVLESMIDLVKKKDQPLYYKAVMAIRNAQAGMISHDLVSLDACCSGIQVMSALTGCVTGARNTGLVDPNVRSDAYGLLQTEMQQLLGDAFKVEREPAKDALMTSNYGSKKKPKEIFGADTPELHAFYQAAYIIAPGASDLLNELINSWRPWALVHEWILPDGFHARCKVMVDKEARIKVEELGNASFTYQFKVNEGMKSYVSNAANVTHSVDAYVLRCIQRRCNYNRAQAEVALDLIQTELAHRSAGESMESARNDLAKYAAKVEYYKERYEATKMADVVILPYLNVANVNQLSNAHLAGLKRIITSMMAHRPFAVITVHDEFKCHANYMNHLRQHYIDIFAEIADSEILSDILSQLYGTQGKVKKLSHNLGMLIRGSNYALS